MHGEREPSISPLAPPGKLLTACTSASDFKGGIAMSIASRWSSRAARQLVELRIRRCERGKKPQRATCGVDDAARARRDRLSGLSAPANCGQLRSRECAKRNRSSFQRKPVIDQRTPEGRRGREADPMHRSVSGKPLREPLPRCWRDRSQSNRAGGRSVSD